MMVNLSQSAIEKEIKLLISTGLTGSASDFDKWIKMEYFKRVRELPLVPEDLLDHLIRTLVKENHLVEKQNDHKEYYVSEMSPLKKKPGMSESFEIIGDIKFSPMQFVRSRVENFLKYQNINETAVIDVLIGVVEAIENATKYGDRGIVRVAYSIDRKKVFKIEMINSIGQNDFLIDLERGKFTSGTTLMRGMMVMEKLFDSVELEIVEERNEANLTAIKYVG